MKHIGSVFFALAAFFPTCNDDSARHDGDCPDVLVSVSNVDDFPDDPLTIENVTIEQNTLKVMMRYGGGCGDVQFTLVAYSYFMESNPVQASLIISFKDDDPCKALISEELCFDLTKLSESYKSNYHAASGTILLRIAGYEPSIDYSF